MLTQCRSLNLDHFLPNQKCLFRENFRPHAAIAHYTTLLLVDSTFVWITRKQGTEDLKRFLWIFVFWSQFSTSSLFGHALQGQIPIDTLTSKNCAVEKRAKYVATLATLWVPNIVVSSTWMCSYWPSFSDIKKYLAILADPFQFYEAFQKYGICKAVS